MNMHRNTLQALRLPAAEPTPGDAIMARLVEVEARLRILGCDTAATLAARFQSDIAKGAMCFLYVRWTADLEGFADRQEVKRARGFYEALAQEARA